LLSYHRWKQAKETNVGTGNRREEKRQGAGAALSQSDLIGQATRLNGRRGEGNEADATKDKGELNRRVHPSIPSQNTVKSSQ
jgi:hypothetical protein